MNLSDLKSAFASKDKLTSDLAAAQAQITQLTSDLETARAEAVTERTRAEGLQAQMDSAQQEIDSLTNQVSTLEGNAQTVGEKMTEAMASIGVPAAQLPAAVEAGAVKSAEELRKQWEEIKDPSARAAFWAKHSEQMMN